MTAVNGILYSYNITKQWAAGHRLDIFVIDNRNFLSLTSFLASVSVVWFCEGDYNFRQKKSFVYEANYQKVLFLVYLKLYLRILRCTLV